MLGAPDANGNLNGGNVSCYDGKLAPPDYHIAANAPCIDKGATGVRRDNVAIDKDLDGKPRTLGLAPDIGCSEKQ
jgi:hypothetical protein